MEILHFLGMLFFDAVVAEVKNNENLFRLTGYTVNNFVTLKPTLHFILGDHKNV